jgi:hypothetical protein
LPLLVVVGNLFFLLWQDGGVDLAIYMAIMVGLVLLGFQVGVVGYFYFHNFDLEPHSNIFLAH